MDNILKASIVYMIWLFAIMGVGAIRNPYIDAKANYTGLGIYAIASIFGMVCFAKLIDNRNKRYGNK